MGFGGCLPALEMLYRGEKPNAQLSIALTFRGFLFLLSFMLFLFRQHFSTSMHLSASACAGACILLEKRTVPRALCVSEVKRSLEGHQPS